MPWDKCAEVLRFFFFFSSRRRHTRSLCDWSSDVCSSDLSRCPVGDLAALLRIVVERTQADRDDAFLETFAEAVALEELRSEERRVGKECRSRGARCH